MKYSKTSRNKKVSIRSYSSYRGRSLPYDPNLDLTKNRTKQQSQRLIKSVSSNHLFSVAMRTKDITSKLEEKYDVLASVYHNLYESNQSDVENLYYAEDVCTNGIRSGLTLANYRKFEYSVTYYLADKVLELLDDATKAFFYNKLKSIIERNRYVITDLDISDEYNLLKSFFIYVINVGGQRGSYSIEDYFSDFLCDEYEETEYDDDSDVDYDEYGYDDILDEGYYYRKGLYEDEEDLEDYDDFVDEDMIDEDFSDEDDYTYRESLDDEELDDELDEELDVEDFESDDDFDIEDVDIDEEDFDIEDEDVDVDEEDFESYDDFDLEDIDEDEFDEELDYEMDEDLLDEEDDEEWDDEDEY